MVQTVQCDQLPIIKLLAHAAKYQTSTVNGLLLGQVEDGGSSIHITDAIPLFHTSSIQLATPVETALAQIDAYCRSSGKVRMIGYYHSDARFQAADLPAIGRKIADKLSDKEPSAVVVLLDNKKLASFLEGEETNPLELFTKDGSKGWKRDSSSQVSIHGASWKSVHETFIGLYTQQKHRGLADFDEHLDDITKDYLNPDLKNLGKFALPGQS